MRRVMGALLLAGALAMLPNPTPADAREALTGCLNESISSCNGDFGGNSFYMVAIRGHCYWIRGAICYAMEPR